MANGGLVAPAGSRLVAEAAALHAVPLLVCCGLYKLSPRFPSDADRLQDLRSPADIVPANLRTQRKPPVIGQSNNQLLTKSIH